jgi:hypothetical protein
LQIAIRIKYAIENTPDTKWYFATITMHKNWHGLGNTPRVRQVMQAGWSKLRKRMARRWKGLMWIKVIEFHKSGTPHIHLVIGISNHYKRHIKTKWLKDNAVSCGLGYMALVGTKGARDLPLDTIGAHNTAFYVAGYVGKGDMIGIRALAYSEGFPEVPPYLDSDLEQWIYEGRTPNFDALADNVDIVYKTERNLIDELEREDKE